MHLYLKFIWKTYQFIVSILVFSSSHHGNIYIYSYQENNLFIQFIYGFNFILVWTFVNVQFVV